MITTLSTIKHLVFTIDTRDRDDMIERRAVCQCGDFTDWCSTEIRLLDAWATHVGLWLVSSVVDSVTVWAVDQQRPR